MTRRLVLFAEDSFHESFLLALITRMAEEKGVAVDIQTYSGTGGITKLHSEFQLFLRDLQNDRASPPDLVIVATDGNCKGYITRRNEIEKVAERYEKFRDLIVYAIPDPHVERWMLIDQQAFQAVFGKGFNAPAQKCERARYKQALIQAIHECGIRPPLGGREYVEDVIQAMDLARAEMAEASLGNLIKDLKPFFNRWMQP